jgi:hypothetical protein
MAIEVEADILVSLGSAVERLTSELAAARVASTTRPNSFKAVASTFADANGNAPIIFEACPNGQRWVLRHLVVGGVTWTTSASGHAYIFHTTPGGPSGADAPVSIFNVIDGDTSGLAAGTGLPWARFYFEGDECVLEGGEALGVMVYGGTSGQQYVAHGRFDRHFH